MCLNNSVLSSERISIRSAPNPTATTMLMMILSAEKNESENENNGKCSTKLTSRKKDNI